ncbi:MAG: LysR family transcriptional regulator [Eubacteriales bacterium]|nr:LysR family transcriptional regulator [Eubacteriales bacterium]
MKIEDIQIFMKLTKTLSFFSTADELFLSPSAVTYAIKNLEKQLGVKLFHRSSHGVTLTEKGEIFYRDMRGMLASWEMAQVHLHEEKEEQKTLRVGVISMTLQRDFSNVVSRFIGEYPSVQPKLSVCPVEDPTAPLRSGRQDLAFIYQDAIMGYPSLSHRHLVSAPLYCVMSPEHPLAAKEEVMLEDLRGETLFVLPPEVNATVSGIRRLGERIASLGEGAVTNIISDDHDYCMVMAEDKRGLTFAPVYPPTCRDSDRLAYRPFRDPELPLEIHVAWKRNHLSPEAKNLIEIALRYFGAEENE